MVNTILETHLQAFAYLSIIVVSVLVSHSCDAGSSPHWYKFSFFEGESVKEYQPSGQPIPSYSINPHLYSVNLGTIHVVGRP